MSFPPIYLSAAVIHLGEEPPIGGDRGVGNLFFSGCNLRCCFCQNHQTSHHPRRGEALSPEQCAERILGLAAQEPQAIGLVSPTHQARSVARAVELARLAGLTLPVVYNSNGTDGPQVLAHFDGLVDLYLPDFKYGSDAIAWGLSQVRDYVHRARRAVREMHRQVGHLPDDQAVARARRGLIVRHLVLPGGLAGTGRVARMLAEDLGEKLWLSLMAQYHPEPLAHTAGGAAALAAYPELGRTIGAAEYQEALDAARLAGLTRLFTQDLATAPTTGLPDFDQAEPFLWGA